jgi:hypothetical protein
LEDIDKIKFGINAIRRGKHCCCKMAAYKNKTQSKNSSSRQPTLKSVEDDLNPKPLAATLLQEFQNIKDKFKNEDEDGEKGTIK